MFPLTASIILTVHPFASALIQAISLWFSFLFNFAFLRMAEALLGVVCENLLSLVQNEFATISGIKEKAVKLSSTLDLIKAVLEDAEEKQLTNRSIKVWLQQLRDAAYVLDDILDECSIESHRLGGLSSFKPNNIMFRRKIGKRLKEITRRFDEIAESKNKFLLTEGVRERSTEVAEWRQTSSVIPQPKVYGREDDKEKIVEFLLSQAQGHDFLSVYPIIGLGGVGKTTLAQMVYNDDRVSRTFNTKIWICISENFSVKRILCSVVESVTGGKYDAHDLDVIERKVQELLQSKRYLLILDDVWKRNKELELGLSQEKWNKLKSVLSCGSKGSSVLVSTRDKDVGAIMGTCQAHYLGGLSEDDCWLLFKQYAFGPDKEERAELIAIGKEIIKKCGGLPLAAQALGGLLRSRSEEKEWLEVKESRLWTLSDENSILPALRLSYFHLTPTLKQCFAFCAILPKDTKIMKEELIHLWMANGFISSRANLEVEDVGNMIWNELYKKSFFQEVEMDDYTGKISFKMHDLVHDLAQSVTGPECMFFENANMIDLSRSTHHIGFSHGLLSSSKRLGKEVESLRTLYQVYYYVCKDEISGSFTRSLRVLHATRFTLPPPENLIHLRYLALIKFKITKIPDSIYNLRKLEILKLKSLWELNCLPKRLTCLQKLRHLVIENCPSLSCMFPNIGKLSCLKTLSVYIVNSKTGHSLAELHNLKLGGKLSIQGLKNVGSLSEAREANLIDKKDLWELTLSWENGDDETESHATNPDQVLEGLQPHSNLKALVIRGYEGLHFPSWMGILGSLVSLCLKDCKNYTQLSLVSKLPSLRRLEISSMDNVQYLDDNESHSGVEGTAFPSLEELRLGQLPKLERLLKVERGEMFPRLSDLDIGKCPKLVLPCLPSVKNLYVFQCNNEFLRSISSLKGLTFLYLGRDEERICFPGGMLRNLTCLEHLRIYGFSKLKELPNEFSNLKALRMLELWYCDKLESLPEQGWESLCSLQTLSIDNCIGLRSLPEGVRHLTSLEYITIRSSPTLEERCKEGTGEDWDKIAHIPYKTICS